MYTINADNDTADGLFRGEVRFNATTVGTIEANSIKDVRKQGRRIAAEHKAATQAQEVQTFEESFEL